MDCERQETVLLVKRFFIGIVALRARQDTRLIQRCAQSHTCRTGQALCNLVNVFCWVAAFGVEVLQAFDKADRAVIQTAGDHVCRGLGERHDDFAHAAQLVDGAEQLRPCVVILVGRFHGVMRCLRDHVRCDLVCAGNFVCCCDICKTVRETLFYKWCIAQFQQTVSKLPDILKYGFLAAHLVKDILAGEFLADGFKRLCAFFHAGHIGEDVALLALTQLEHLRILHSVGDGLLIGTAAIDGVLDLIPHLFRHIPAGFIHMQGFGLHEVCAFTGLCIQTLQSGTDLIRNTGDRHLHHIRRDIADLGAWIQQESQAACFGQLGERRDGVFLCNAVTDTLHRGRNSFAIPGVDALKRLDFGIGEPKVLPLAAQFLCAAGVQIVDAALRIPQSGHWVVLHQRDCGGLRELAAGRQLFGHTAQQFNGRIAVTVGYVLLRQFVAQWHRRRVTLEKHILIGCNGLALSFSQHRVRAGFRLGVGQLVIDFGCGDKILLNGIGQVGVGAQRFCKTTLAYRPTGSACGICKALCGVLGRGGNAACRAVRSALYGVCAGDRRGTQKHFRILFQINGSGRISTRQIRACIQTAVFTDDGCRFLQRFIQHCAAEAVFYTVDDCAADFRQGVHSNVSGQIFGGVGGHSSDGHGVVDVLPSRSGLSVSGELIHIIHHTRVGIQHKVCAGICKHAPCGFTKAGLHNAVQHRDFLCCIVELAARLLCGVCIACAIHKLIECVILRHLARHSAAHSGEGVLLGILVESWYKCRENAVINGL